MAKSKNSLDGNRVRALLGADTKALLATYRQFEDLLPATMSAGASHRGEDGRFVESLLRSYLRALLPSDLEVASGFIMRPAVKTGINGRERKGLTDSNTGQLDVLVFDSANYPVFKRFEETVVVPPEGVVATISVKKSLQAGHIQAECESLRQAASLCRCLLPDGSPTRGPFLAIAGMSFDAPPKKMCVSEKIFEKIKDAYAGTPPPTFDEAVGLIGSVEGISVFKKRPAPATAPTDAEYLWLEHREGEDHWTLQLLLTGILSVYYDQSRNRRRRPGFSGFEPGRAHDGVLGKVPVGGLR